MTAPTPRLEPFRPTVQDRGLPGALRDPLRIALVLAGFALLVGSALSWVEYWLPGHGWQELSSFTRTGDGAITLVLGIVLAAVAWSDNTATSRVPLLVALPLGIGLACLAVLKFSYDADQEFIAGLASGGGHGDFLPAFWVALVGASVAALVGLLLLVRRRDEVSFAVRVSSNTVTVAAAGLVGAVTGIGAAVVLGEDFGSNATITGSAVTLLAVVFALVGAFLGTRVGRAFVGGTPEDGAH